MIISSELTGSPRLSFQIRHTGFRAKDDGRLRVRLRLANSGGFSAAFSKWIVLDSSYTLYLVAGHADHAWEFFTVFVPSIGRAFGKGVRGIDNLQIHDTTNAMLCPSVTASTTNLPGGLFLLLAITSFCPSSD